MKSHLLKVVSLYEGILKDAAAYWPSSTSSFEKDLSYLRRAGEQRGLPFFTIVLPSMCKVLEKGLSQGFLPTEGYPQGYPTRRKRPELFRDLYDRIFSESGLLKPEADPDAVFMLRTLLNVMKKYRIQCHPDLVEKALSDFYEIESQLPPSYLNTWDDEVPLWRDRRGHPLGDHHNPSVDSSASREWSQFRRFVRKAVLTLGAVPYWDLRPKHGPGAVSEKFSGSKYDFLNWPRKLDGYFPYDWFATGSLELHGDYSSVEYPSRLIAVPKTQKGPRLICAESIAHQWMQQAIWDFLDKAVQRSIFAKSITFRSQENSRKRALSASIDGSLCTVDLSSASDRLSTRLVEYCFQGSYDLLNALHASRSRYLSQTISDNHPRVIVMRKFAPMGSAVTFPVQSIVFTLLSVWGLKLSEESHYDLSWETLHHDFERVTVFGDDIIAPTHAYKAIVHVLETCGLKVNTDKSFFEGNFRESCGMDAFKGVQVTPVHLLEFYSGSPASMATTLETANNFHVNGLWNAAQAVVDLLPEKERKLLAVVGGEGGYLGLMSYCGPDLSHRRRRWNADLQRHEHLVLTVTSKVTRRQGRDWSGLTQYFTERPDPMLPWASGQVSRVKLRKRLTWVGK